MILDRLGNKTKIAHKIYQLFPQHSTYIEPFFGAGGMFFNKPKAKYNILNDLDDDVFNLFMVLVRNKDDLFEMVSKMPIHQSLWNYWRKNKETDPLLKAVRFLMLSNFGYMGKHETLRFCNSNAQGILLMNIDKTYEFIKGCEFTCSSFDVVFNKIPKENKNDKMVMIYSDPPYLDTTNTYSHSFTEELSHLLFDKHCECDCNWAISEFKHPFIMDQIKKRGLHYTEIGERVNMKNRRMEILITNFSVQPTFYDLWN